MIRVCLLARNHCILQCQCVFVLNCRKSRWRNTHVRAYRPKCVVFSFRQLTKQKKLL